MLCLFPCFSAHCLLFLPSLTSDIFYFEMFGTFTVLFCYFPAAFLGKSVWLQSDYAYPSSNLSQNLWMQLLLCFFKISFSNFWICFNMVPDFSTIVKAMIQNSVIPIKHFIRSNINFKKVFWEALWNTSSGMKSLHRNMIRNNSVCLNAPVMSWWTLHDVSTLFGKDLMKCEKCCNPNQG